MRAVDVLVTSVAFVFLSEAAAAQGTVADYQRAIGLREKYQALPVNVPEPPT
jgi:hypothetical protein